jgi:signal transduction histidine kinase/ActR/RegA family two-component response regulator
MERYLHDLRHQLDRKLGLLSEAETRPDGCGVVLQTLLVALGLVLEPETLAIVVPAEDETYTLAHHLLQGSATPLLGQQVWSEDLLQGWRQLNWCQAWPLVDSQEVLGWLVAVPPVAITDSPTVAPWLQTLRSELIGRAVEQMMPVLQQVRSRQVLQHKADVLMAQNQELAQVSQLKSEFLANTSHEIRTPLSSILGFTHLLREQGFTPSNLRHQEYLRIILTSGQHLLALINDILDLSKIEANQLDLHWEALELEPLCKTALMLVQERAGDRGLNLKLTIEPDIGPLMADPLRLKQMLFNLLSNAVKFTQRGSVGLRVARVDQWVRFTVWDTGVGIPPEQRALLFRPYQQLSQTAARREEGTGLGLALTQKLAELHGGRVEVQSVVNEGSQFSILLPLQPVPSQQLVPIDPPAVQPPSASQDSAVLEAEPSMAALSRAKRSHRPTRSYHILLVEDNPHNAHLIITYLCKLGYEVTWAQDACNLWRALKQSLPAMILMDINLPDVNGLTLIRQLRQHNTYGEIPIIVQTAMAMMGDREICLEAGANDYIAKPLDLQQLSGLVKQYSDPNSDPKVV